MTVRRPLNLKHLRYFAETARRQSVSAAARALYVTPQTVSGQIQELEHAIGQTLFERSGKRLILTPAGGTALDYATAIFNLVDELASVLRSEARPRRITLRVGITDSVPKLQTVAALTPLISRHRNELELICHEGPYADLLGRVAAGELDMVLGDTTVPPSLARALHTAVLSEAGTSFLATRAIHARLKGRFPRSLDGAPLLAGASAGSIVNQALDAWFTRHEVQPNIVGRIDDSALLKGFAHGGLGIAAVPTSIERDVTTQYGLEVIGRTEEVRQVLYLVRARSRRPHPLVAEIEESRRRR